MKSGQHDAAIALTWANLITLLRIAMIPLFGWLWIRRQPAAAWTFALIASTDALDGFLARRLHQQSRIGRLLDPAADKCLALVALLLGLYLRVLPIWFVVAVVGRDAVISAAAAGFAFIWRDARFGPQAWRPSRIGKAATVALSVTVFFAIAIDLQIWASVRPALLPAMVATATLAVTATVQYGARAIHALRIARRARSRR